MSDYQYSLALTITYIPYIVVEIPASLVLKCVGANILLPALVILWGFTTTLQGFVNSYQGLLAARFFLVLFEGGLLPGIMLVMSRFYKRDQFQMHMILLFTADSLAGAFSGLLVSSNLGMDGCAGDEGWQWIFILVCNCLHSSPCFSHCYRRERTEICIRRKVVVFGLVTFFILPRTPTSSQFLTGKENEAIHVAPEQDWTPDSGEDVFSGKQVVAAFTTPQVSATGLYSWDSLNLLATHYLPRFSFYLSYSSSPAISFSAWLTLQPPSSAAWVIVLFVHHSCLFRHLYCVCCHCLPR